MDEASFTLLFPAGPEDEAGGRELGTTERDRTPRLKINFSLAAGHASGYEDEENSSAAFLWYSSCARGDGSTSQVQK